MHGREGFSVLFALAAVAPEQTGKHRDTEGSGLTVVFFIVPLCLHRCRIQPWFSPVCSAPELLGNCTPGPDPGFRRLLFFGSHHATRHATWASGRTSLAAVLFSEAGARPPAGTAWTDSPSFFRASRSQAAQARLTGKRVRRVTACVLGTSADSRQGYAAPSLRHMPAGLLYAVL